MAFIKNSSNGAGSPVLLGNRYKSGRMAILVMVIFTVINTALLFVNLDVKFLFSLSLPYFAVLYGRFFTGRLPDEAYMDESGRLNKPHLPDAFLGIAIVLAVAVVAAYFLMWLFAKKRRPGLLVAASVMLGLDTLFLIFMMINGMGVSLLMDLVFHGLALYWLIAGAVAGFKIAKLPPEDPAALPVGVDEEAVRALREASASQEEQALSEEEIYEEDEDAAPEDAPENARENEPEDPD